MASSDVDPILVDEGGGGDENSEDTQDKGEGLHFCVTIGPFCINRKMPINRI